MPNRFDKVIENTPGSFYVDNDCIACDTCHDIAPDHFVLTSHCSNAYVIRQPQTQSERSRCSDAMVACPVEAIGNDGIIDTHTR